jgi:hypothetical protein
LADSCPRRRREDALVEDAGGSWHVDVYSGILQGVVIAEIELNYECQELILPRWIGKEVTGDSFYKKINMRARALNAHRETLRRLRACENFASGVAPSPADDFWKSKNLQSVIKKIMMHGCNSSRYNRETLRGTTVARRWRKPWADL